MEALSKRGAKIFRHQSEVRSRLDLRQAAPQPFELGGEIKVHFCSLQKLMVGVQNKNVVRPANTELRSSWYYKKITNEGE